MESLLSFDCPSTVGAVAFPHLACGPGPPSLHNPEEECCVGSSASRASALTLLRPLPSQQSPSEDTLGHILCVIRHIAKHLPQSTRDMVAGECLPGSREKACLSLYFES